MICSNCGATDAGPGPFCMSCGQRLSTSSAAGSPVLSDKQPNDVTPLPSTPMLLSQSVGRAQKTDLVAVRIWGPFAGYGMRGRHVSWLINDQGDRAKALQDMVAARFERRKIPGAEVQPMKLVRRGVLVDSRPYFLIRRGLTTAGLYIAQFGRDLYVSQVTYFKGPISKARALIVLAMITFAAIYPVIVNSVSSRISLSLLGGFENVGSAMVVICCLGPLYVLDWLVLGILAVFSGYKWLTEKDFLTALRVPPNEFDIDDTVALEKSVEQTVREALDAVGIEQRLMPPAEEYSFRRRLI